MTKIIDDIYYRAMQLGFDLGAAVDTAAYEFACCARGGVEATADWTHARIWAEEHWRELVPDVAECVRRGELYEDETPSIPDARRLVVDLIAADCDRRAIAYRYGSFGRAMQCAPSADMPLLGTV